MLSELKRTIKAVIDFIPSRVRSKRRVRDLSEERVHVTSDDIERDLDSMPIPNGAVVLVHSSLKAIGFVEGGPQAVVQAMVRSIVDKRNGTLVFPTYSINGTMYNTLVMGGEGGDVVFDVTTTRSNLGALPESFRNWPGVRRSVHPTHSFSALGPLAEELTGSHHTCGSSFGTGSPMAKMLDHDGWLLGLGTNLGNVTMYHCVEEIEDDFPFNVYTSDSPITVQCRDWDGNAHTLSLSAHDGSVSKTRIDRPENKAIRDYFTSQFEKNAGLEWCQVCEARTWLVSTRGFYDETARLMRDGITIYTTEAELLEREAR